MEDPPLVQICALCRVVRRPLYPLVHEGEMHAACRTCWCLQQTVALMQHVGATSDSAAVLEDAAVAIYAIAREAVGPAPAAPIEIEE